MELLQKLLILPMLFTVIYIAGCGSQSDVLGERESRVKKLLTTQNRLTESYSIKRASNGVYVYTDNTKPIENPKPINIITN